MASEGLFEESAMGNNELYEVELSAKNWKNTVSANIMGSDRTPSPGFDCNICLDFVQDPVVTICGHLYCWPCIYKWLNMPIASSEYSESDKPEPLCPVCKSSISESMLVPLYGRGKAVKTPEEKASNIDLVIPPRPGAPVSSLHMIPTPASQASVQQALHPNHFNRHRNFRNQQQSYYLHSPRLGFGGFSAPTHSVHPVIGMFSQMVYERMFGNSVADIYGYGYPYISEQHGNPRLRRHVMQADKSLSRICFFLCCCIILCLVLF